MFDVVLLDTFFSIVMLLIVYSPLVFLFMFVLDLVLLVALLCTEEFHDGSNRE